MTAAPPPDASTPARPTTTKVEGEDYERVKVFYGTDRATTGLPPDRLRSLHWSVVGALSGAACGLIAVILVAAGFVGPGIGRKLFAVVVGSGILCLGLAGFWVARFVLAAEPVFYGDRQGELAVGTCVVSIPSTHRHGQLEAPNKLKSEVWDPAKHVMLLEVTPKSVEAILAEIRELYESISSSETQMLVFVHGFNVTFEDAARRTAQMSYDLEFPGVPVFYSWPSKGVLSPAAYLADAESVAATVQNFKRFLTSVVTKAGASRIHLIAHSMGNRALTAALTEIARDPAYRGRTVFHEVLLTAPDVQASVFDQIYQEMRSTAVRTTLYASREDAALRYAARWVDNELRVGDCSRTMVVKPGMESIDVSDVETDLFGGHWYYAENRHVLADIRAVLKRKPEEGCDLRTWLRASGLPSAMYWKLVAR